MPPQPPSWQYRWGVQFVEAPVTDPTSQALLTEYFEYRASTFPEGKTYQPTFPFAGDFSPPRGSFVLLLDDDGSAIGCGGVRLLGMAAGGGSVFEIKHLWLKPHTRGRGLGRHLLDELERRAAAFGARDL